MVEVTGLEPAASCSQSTRATNCATPRFYLLRAALPVVTKIQASLVYSPPFIKSLPLETAYCIRHRRRAPFLPNCATSVATKALSAFARLACQSPSCRHSLFLASSRTASARNAPLDFIYFALRLISCTIILYYTTAILSSLKEEPGGSSFLIFY